MEPGQWAMIVWKLSCVQVWSGIVNRPELISSMLFWKTALFDFLLFEAFSSGVLCAGFSRVSVLWAEVINADPREDRTRASHLANGDPESIYFPSFPCPGSIVGPEQQPWQSGLLSGLLLWDQLREGNAKVSPNDSINLFLCPVWLHAWFITAV